MTNPSVLQRFEKARILFRSNCSKPPPDNLYDKQAWNMSGTHLMLTESMLSVYKQAEHIQPQDYADFAFYALLTVSVVRGHHELEEENFLPRMAPEFQAPIAEEHHAFSEPLHDLEKYLLDVTRMERTGPSSVPKPATNPNPNPPLFDGHKVVAAIESFAEPLLDHLEHELDYLQGDRLRECGLPLSKLEAWQQFEKNAAKGMNPWIFLVFVVAHTPSNSTWPPLPPGIRSILVPWVFWWRYRKTWRFIPPQEPL